MQNAGQFLKGSAGWRTVIDLLGIAISAGIYIVPLYAIMQHRSDIAHRARIIAANNIINALFMVVAAIGTLWMLKRAFTIPQVFLTMAILNVLVSVYIRRLLPNP
ncbi:MAG: hypothetical protein HY201_04210 [Nitrospirae bacterium]|nr:hypothetical protein [Candidatus Troglogloeales bacterium]MBI3598635.1 hypothetical protein [Candidatus Troglogloeales bacterium]